MDFSSAIGAATTGATTNVTDNVGAVLLLALPLVIGIWGVRKGLRLFGFR